MSARPIVVADDEVSVLAYITAVLRDHTVKTFSSPREALRHIGTVEEPPLLLITDVVMPRMNGRELALAYQERFPDMPVLLISGYRPEPETLGGEVPLSWGFLSKPFRPRDLKDAVDALVSDSDASAPETAAL